MPSPIAILHILFTHTPMLSQTTPIYMARTTFYIALCSAHATTTTRVMMNYLMNIARWRNMLHHWRNCHIYDCYILHSHSLYHSCMLDHRRMSDHIRYHHSRYQSRHHLGDLYHMMSPHKWMCQCYTSLFICRDYSRLGQHQSGSISRYIYIYLERKVS